MAERKLESKKTELNSNENNAETKTFEENFEENFNWEAVEDIELPKIKLIKRDKIFESKKQIKDLILRLA